MLHLIILALLTMCLERVLRMTLQIQSMRVTLRTQKTILTDAIQLMNLKALEQKHAT